MRRKTIIIGQAPSQTSDPRFPLAGDPLATRLASMAGLMKGEYLEEFERFNLLNRWPGKNGKGDAWPMRLAMIEAAIMKPTLVDRRVIFLGQRVAAAFHFHAKLLKWTECSGLFFAACMPHPSGVNLWYNDPKNVKRASKFLRGEVRCRKTK